MEYLFLTPGNNGGVPMGDGGCTIKICVTNVEGDCTKLCPDYVCVHCEAFCGARCDCFSATGPGAARM